MHAQGGVQTQVRRTTAGGAVAIGSRLAANHFACTCGILLLWRSCWPFVAAECTIYSRIKVEDCETARHAAAGTLLLAFGSSVKGCLAMSVAATY